MLEQRRFSKAITEEVKQAAGKVAEYFAGYFGTWTIDLGIRMKLFHTITQQPEGMTSAELASKTGLHPLYVDVWCRNAYAAELLAMADSRYTIPPAMAEILLNRDSPFYISGTAHVNVALREPLTSLREWMKTGEGIWWDKAPREFVDAVAESTRAFYSRLLNFANENPEIRSKLEHGATLLEVGVGYGAGLIRFAERYPNTKLIGVDGDAHSIEQAKINFTKAKFKDRVRFVLSTFEDYSESEAADVALINVSLHEAREIKRTVLAMHRALKTGGVIIVSEFPYPNSPENLRTTPGRVMSGIQYFEAMIGDQLLSTKEFVPLLREAGFRDVEAVDLASVHVVIWGFK